MKEQNTMLTSSILSSLRRAGRLIKMSDLGLQVITCRTEHVRNIIILITLLNIRTGIAYSQR